MSSAPTPAAVAVPARAGAPGDAIAGAFWLVLVGLALPFGIAFLAGLTSLHSSSADYVLAALIILAGASIGGAGFGRYVGRRAGGDLRLCARAGALGYALPAVAAAVILGISEPLALSAATAAHFKIHVLFTLLFAPTTFAVVAVLGLSLGRGLRDRALGKVLAWKGGAAAGATFLVVDVLQDQVGRRVGAPGAAASATMVTVALISLTAAAAAAGIAMGRAIEAARASVPSDG